MNICFVAPFHFCCLFLCHKLLTNVYGTAAFQPSNLLREINESMLKRENVRLSRVVYCMLHHLREFESPSLSCIGQPFIFFSLSLMCMFDEIFLL